MTISAFAQQKPKKEKVVLKNADLVERYPDRFEGNIARAIARVSCKQEVNPRWLSYWLNSPSVQWWLVSSTKEVARKTLNLGDLASLVCPVPQEAEQTEIKTAQQQAAPVKA